MSAVFYHDGRFPPVTLDWPQLLPLIGPARLLNIAEGRNVF